MKRFIHAIFVALLAICGQQAHAATPQNPKADDKAVVTASDVATRGSQCLHHV